MKTGLKLKKMIAKGRTFFSVLLFMTAANPASAGTVDYELVIDYRTVNFTGRDVQAMTINGSIPGPTLYMTEGDIVRIKVRNLMKEETSIHWHGILLPNSEDGVPYLTTPPIKAGTIREFSFPVIQSGTYWYHSHTGLQEQRGVYGSIVIYPKDKPVIADREYVLVLSDWTDEDPGEVMRTLKRGSEYYSLKKGLVQSLRGAIRGGAFMAMVKRSLQRMPPMDLSDVAYDRFLINGIPEIDLEAKPGEKVRLRIINAGASTYFYLNSAAGPMKVVSADGLDVKPLKLDRLLIAIAETYDVIVTIPDEGGRFEFRATAQDGSGSASVWLGSGSQMGAFDIPRANLYMMHGGHNMQSGHIMDHGDSGEHSMDMSDMKMNGMDMEDMDMSDMTLDHMDMTGMVMDGMHGGELAPIRPPVNEERPLPPYKYLEAPASTLLPKNSPTRTITLRLTGDMERYIWAFDNKILTEADKINVKKGESLRVEFVNETMMHHPLHLHGHFFRVLNGKGSHAPLKHTVDIPPMGREIIEFYANEEKDWFLHCHILYHMKAGMSRVVSYEGSEVDPELAEARKDPKNFLNRDPWFAWGEVSLLTQMHEGSLVTADTRDIFMLEWGSEWGHDKEYEVELTYSRYVNRFVTLYGGAEKDEEDTTAIIGLNYLLPLNLESRWQAEEGGEFIAEVEGELQLTDRLSTFGTVSYHTEDYGEWQAGLEWTLGKSLSLIAKYNSEFGSGAGLTLRF